MKKIFADFRLSSATGEDEKKAVFARHARYSIPMMTFDFRGNAADSRVTTHSGTHISVSASEMVIRRIRTNDDNRTGSRAIRVATMRILNAHVSTRERERNSTFHARRIDGDVKRNTRVDIVRELLPATSRNGKTLAFRARESTG